MRFDDPVGFAKVRKRHALLGFASLCTLLPREGMQWSIVQSIKRPDDDDAFEILRIVYSGRLNARATALVSRLQSDADHAVLRGRGETREKARQAALFLSLALGAGGEVMMMCRANDRASVRIAELAEDCFQRVSGGSSIARELPRLHTELARLGCIAEAA